MTALTADELLAWLERTTTGWRELLKSHPEALALPCSTRETTNAGQLLQHIVAVELRYAERLNELPETGYDALPSDNADGIFAVHDRAVSLIRQKLGESDASWEQEMEVTTRSAGRIRASRRAILVHLAMHGIRHYAQLATLVREGGIAPGWPMDYLFIAVVDPQTSQQSVPATASQPA